MKPSGAPGSDPAEIEEVILGCAMQEGTTRFNVARQAALAAGLPVTVSGMTVDRQCSSGLMAIATLAKQIICDGVPIGVGGGLESISLVQNEHMNRYRTIDEKLTALHPAINMPMIDTAEIVSKRYGIGREAQDEYSLESQRRTAAGQAAGRFDIEIAPMQTRQAVVNKETKEVSYKEVTLKRDEGNRADTTLEGLRSLKPVRGEGFTVTAGNASQLSDGASASVLVERKLAEKRGLPVLGIYRGMAVAGCEPDEMGIGPVFAVPRLLERNGLKMSDIGLWELNEAFAVQVLYCQGQARHPERALERRWRRDLHRPPLRDERRADDRACAHRGETARGEVRRGDDVYRRRDGRSGAVRGGLRARQDELEAFSARPP